MALLTLSAEALEGKGAVRMTGGGFGGAVICLCRDEEIAVVKAAVEREYHAKFDLHADIFVCQAGYGFSCKYRFLTLKQPEFLDMVCG